jgi:hypothetical protein
LKNNIKIVVSRWKMKIKLKIDKYMFEITIP